LNLVAVLAQPRRRQDATGAASFESESCTNPFASKAKPCCEEIASFAAPVSEPARFADDRAP
jgi:hypothetical protein